MYPVINAEGLSKSFEVRGDVVEAVRGVNLEVKAGDIFGFLGPNGAGKTTTLRMLSTLLRPGGGRAKVVGYDLLREPGRVRERIGYVSQAGGVDVQATGLENLLFQARLCGLGRKKARERVSEMVERFELSGLAGRKAATYSGGQKQRLALAIELVNRPELLFFDEPTVGLDPQSRARLWDEIRGLRDTGATVFLTTHYLDEADALCDRLSIIDEGRIVTEGTPEELKQRISGDVVSITFDVQNGGPGRARELLDSGPTVREVQEDDDTLRVYVENGEQSLPDVLRMLDGAGCKVQTIALTRPSLDDVFLRQTGRSLREPAN